MAHSGTLQRKIISSRLQKFSDGNSVSLVVKQAFKSKSVHPLSLIKEFRL